MAKKSLQHQTRWQFLADEQFWLAILAAVIVWIVAMPFVNNVPSGQNFNPIIVILLYPILEELAFRGFVQSYLADKIQRTVLKLSAANILTSLLFVGWHLFYHPPLWAIAVFVPSLIFGYFKDRTNWVLPSILLHIFYNAGYFYGFVV